MSDINELYERDPLELSRDPESLDRLIADLRDQRRRFNLGDTKAGAAKKSKPKSLASVADSDFDSIMDDIKI